VATAAGAAAWLIPPFVDPAGRDSLGRGLDPASIAAAVASDRRVRQERAEQWSYLEAVYRNPGAAQRQLARLVARDGHTSAAQRIAADPARLGELRGRTGLFAGAGTRAERLTAERVVPALVANVQRIGEAEAAAILAYRRSVEAQHAADRTAIPHVSVRAERVIRAQAMAGAADHESIGGRRVFRTAKQAEDADVAAELRAFTAAVRQRFGEDALRAMLRAASRTEGTDLEVRRRPPPSVPDDLHSAFYQMARLVALANKGERLARTAGMSVHVADDDEQESERQREGIRMRQ
jgi:hypothetical protein